ncbi:MAG: WG repeat-containing protein [Clostridia bacterium]|nr:WG repeat-containing protein [Clostridia bacterium]
MLIKKNKPKVIQILSYVAVIILAILEVLNVIHVYWNIIAVVMQIIYIHNQEKNIMQSKIRKITNIILYNVLQLVFTVGFLGMIVSSLVITKVKDEKRKEELFVLLYDYTINLEGVANEELLIPVEKDNLYGFMDENGKEKIPCQYDRVSYFNEVEIGNNQYYIALAKIEDNFIIIDKKGNILLHTTALDRYDNRYLVKNRNNKMVLLDEELNVISKEYDKIISTTQIDISPSFTSYYES